MIFSGFDDWIGVFRGGKQIDSAGRDHDGDALIEKAIATFRPSYHEPPLVIGHPKDDAPAYGWVADLKKIGNTLFAKFKDVSPGFANAVRAGFFKKRSSAFYPDGRLKHVAFLGAAPPAVKGLPDLAFREDTGGVLEFLDHAESIVSLDPSIAEQGIIGERIAAKANKGIIK